MSGMSGRESFPTGRRHSLIRLPDLRRTRVVARLTSREAISTGAIETRLAVRRHARSSRWRTAGETRLARWRHTRRSTGDTGLP